MKMRSLMTPMYDIIIPIEVRPGETVALTDIPEIASLLFDKVIKMPDPSTCNYY